MFVLLRPARSASESCHPLYANAMYVKYHFQNPFTKSFRAFFHKRLNLGSDTTLGVATPEPGPTRLEDPNRNPGGARPKPFIKYISFINVFVLKSLRKRFHWWIRIESGMLNSTLSKSFHSYKHFSFAKAFSVWDKPINNNKFNTIHL